MFSLIHLKGLVQAAARTTPWGIAWLFSALSGGIPGLFLTPCSMVLFTILFSVTNHKCAYHLYASLPLIQKHTRIQVCHHLAFLSAAMLVFLYKEFLEGVPQAWNIPAESTSCFLNLPVYDYNCTLVCLRITGLSTLENNHSCLWVWQAELDRVSPNSL